VGTGGYAGLVDPAIVTGDETGHRCAMTRAIDRDLRSAGPIVPVIVVTGGSARNPGAVGVNQARVIPIDARVRYSYHDTAPGKAHPPHIVGMNALDVPSDGVGQIYSCGFAETDWFQFVRIKEVDPGDLRPAGQCLSVSAWTRIRLWIQ
jgi:hypothetical protein